MTTAINNTGQRPTPVRPETRVSLPGHVVYRELPLQTVVLNLATGKYHGLNPSSGRMLAALEGGRTVAAAARTVAARYGEPRARIEHDLCELCSRLLERGIVRLVRSDCE